MARSKVFDRSKCKEKKHPEVELKGEPFLPDYDAIVISTSGGKDSECAMDLAVERAKQQGVLERVLAVHAILPDVEWPGVEELVEKQARFFGVPVVFVQSDQKWRSWLDYAIERKQWPGFGTRYCTKQWKYTPVNTLFTALRRKFQAATGVKQIRILHVMGLRAEESDERECLYYYFHVTDPSRTNSVKHTDTWLPVFRWTTAQIWDHIHKRKLPYHPVYDQGMARLSCVFCPLAGKQDIVTAAALNPKALQVYVDAEKKIGKPIKPRFWLRDVQKSLRAGKVPVVESSYEELYCWQCPGMLG